MSMRTTIEVRESRPFGITTPGESRTQQAFKDQVDINNIVKRYASGALGPLPTREAVYADFTGPTDLQGAMERVAAARGGFMRLPADVRAAVGNNPVALLAALEDPDQAAELRELGLKFGEPAEEGAPPTDEAPSTPPPQPTAEPSASGGEST